MKSWASWVETVCRASTRCMPGSVVDNLGLSDSIATDSALVPSSRVAALAGTQAHAHHWLPVTTLLSECRAKRRRVQCLLWAQTISSYHVAAAPWRGKTPFTTSPPTHPALPLLAPLTTSLSTYTNRLNARYGSHGDNHSNGCRGRKPIRQNNNNCKTHLSLTNQCRVRNWYFDETC